MQNAVMSQEIKEGTIMNIVHKECGNDFAPEQVVVKRKDQYEGLESFVFDCPCCGAETNTMDCE